jgi:HSP20 family protein
MARELMRWPGRDFPSLRKELDRLFEGFTLDIPFAAQGEWAPAMDITEDPEAFAVKAELPGMDPKAIDIQVTGDVLTIRGERKQEKEERKENTIRTERVYGSFSRSVRLPSAVDAKSVEAKYRAGVLSIRLPKTEETRRKKVEIKVE